MSTEKFIQEDVHDQMADRAATLYLLGFSKQHIKLLYLAIGLLIINTLMFTFSAFYTGTLIDELRAKEFDKSVQTGILVLLLEFFALITSFTGRKNSRCVFIPRAARNSPRAF